MNKYEFLYPHSSFSGKVTPENISFDEKLQTFSQKVNYISNFQTAGKISPILAYLQVERLWQELEQTKEKLDNNKNT